MNAYQRVKLTMYLVVRDYLAAFAAITAAIPNLSVYITSYLASILQIQVLAEQQMLDKKGSTGYKTSIKKSLITQAVDISSKVYAYAKYTNNMLLMSEVKATSSQLSHLADVDLKSAAQAIYDLTQTNIAALAPYGLTAATQTSYQNAINLFVSNLTKPRLTIADHKQITQQLAALFDATDATLLNMKILVNTQKISQPNFYNGFHGAMKLNRTDKSSVSLKALAIDYDTKEPIQGVSFVFKLDYEASQIIKPAVPYEIEKLTAEKGGFRIKSMPDGVYQVRVYKIGYQEQNITVVVNSDQLTVVKVELKRNEVKP